ncbi:uncharacterized protein LOC125072648 [Vanessa atalanta]|uniref:uncharacterized protein LOC125072648 n=1 Tax=Vanessa atalanta TaxID=42275 RepID=UPI001FCD2234|nr:uncharacterized protein LOC125072648 [Vanessa atalanta]
MKKVRFESPVKTLRINAMNPNFQRECHSPRPFMLKQVQSAPSVAPMNYLENRPMPFTNDPIQRFECGDSTPYPVVNKTYLTHNPNTEKHSCSPSNELDLSMLDSTYNKPRHTLPRQNIVNSYQIQSLKSNFNVNPMMENKSTRILTPIENNVAASPPNVLNKKDDFFLRRDNLNDLKTIQSQFNNLQLDKENNPLLKKTEIMTLGIPISKKLDTKLTEPNSSNEMNHLCKCYHCIHILNTQSNMKHLMNDEYKHQYMAENHYKICHCSSPLFKRTSDCQCNNYSPMNHTYFPSCNCNKTPGKSPQTGVTKKNWTLEKYEQSNKPTCLDIEKQDKIIKEKREPTVADLFKIIKLQNEQLQLLQEKVDKFISANKTYEPQKVTQPLQNYVTEHVEVKSIGTDEKISIGVMTSFEMYRTSTIINKEIVKQNEAQIQCNRSQISIKEVVTKAHPVNLNFLDGIAPVSNSSDPKINENTQAQEIGDLTKNTDTGYVDKTLNDMSLYNVQVDNPITPLMSPEQSLYLDVRDYSDSDTSDDQSNVGWTYYNKVMTHVNGMLQESDMPSSASALYRNNKQKCLQMQIDKTNISVAKRVTFGDDPFQIEQPQLHAPTTDTSLKMNQLAAKYLKNGHGPQILKSPSPKPGAVPVDMSLATRNYMEKHKLLQGNNKYQNGHRQVEIPKFLDITALKQQPKFL